MIDNSQAWLERAEAILHQPGMPGQGAGAEAAQFAVSILAALYGPESPQLKQFYSGFGAIQKVIDNPKFLDFNIYQYARGVIRNTAEELRAGLTVRIRVAVAGEILVELIRLAKEIMVDRTEESKKHRCRPERGGL